MSERWDPDSSGTETGESSSVPLKERIPWGYIIFTAVLSGIVSQFSPFFHLIYYGLPAGYPGSMQILGFGIIVLASATYLVKPKDEDVVRSQDDGVASHFRVVGIVVLVFATFSFVSVPETRFISGIWILTGVLLITVTLESVIGDESWFPVVLGSKRSRYAVICVAIALIVVSMTLVPFTNSISQRTQLAEETIGNAENSSLEEMPDMSPEDARMMTLDVGRGKATYSMDDARYSVGEGDITHIDGTYYMTYPRVPEGPYNTWVLKQKGAFLVNMSTMSRDVKTIDARFECGEGMLLQDNIEYHLKEQKPNNMYGEKFPVKKGGEVYMVVVRTRFEQQTKDSGVKYQVPRFAGVAIVDTDCNVTWQSPEEAAQNKMLEMNNIYPYDLAKKRAKSTRLRGGYLNTIVRRSNVPKLSKVPSKNNGQPFLIPTKNGTEEMVMLEPSGSGNGLKEIWMFDGLTGRPERVNVTNDLTGPARAVEIVREQNPDVNFGETVIASEVTPQFINDHLYYMVRVVSVEGSGISYIAFVDAETNELYRADSTAEVRAFITYGPAGIDSETDSGKITGVFKVVKKDGSGNVTDTMVVGENESVVIRPVNNSTSTAGQEESGGN